MSFEIYNKVGRLRGNYKIWCFGKKSIRRYLSKNEQNVKGIISFRSLPTSYLELHDV